ncbi:hypothetical protein MUP07_10455 [Candidatus Bathyarchaeota archaeon]|nr:hypothetical protein [Candidatus Bathyarchaeota archaeon]
MRIYVLRSDPNLRVRSKMTHKVAFRQRLTGGRGIMGFGETPAKTMVTVKA